MKESDKAPEISDKLADEIDKVAGEAYEMAAQVLKTAVETAKSEADFIHNLRVVQVFGQRTLALLIYNTFQSSQVSIEEQISRITEAIKFEVDDLAKGHKEGQLQSVDIDLEKSDKATLQ